jgi:hypothetical protein
MGDTPDTPFWKAVRGEIPPPPSAALLGGSVWLGAAQRRAELTGFSLVNRRELVASFVATAAQCLTRYKLLASW